MPQMEDLKNLRQDIDAPLWDLSTFYGRLRHFFFITDFRYCFVSKMKLYEAHDIVEKCRSGTLSDDVSDAALRHAKKLTEAAFHPDSGELQNFIGRMTFQVPGGMLITAAMLQFYRTNLAVVSWQWINQSFNALVNYTNRNAASELTTKQMAVAYVMATSSALLTALGLKAYLATRAGTLLQRFVPFIAVAAANCVNIPLTRQSELRHGVMCFDNNNNRVVESKYAAAKGISQVVVSRIAIAAPGMVLMPFVMEALEKKAWFMKYQRYHLVFQTFMVGVFLTVMVPVGCALFPQRSSIPVQKLEILDGNAYQQVLQKYKDKTPPVLYFNKGL